MLIDTHAHLNFNAFKDDARKIIEQCLKNDVWMINVGSRLNTSKRAVWLAQKYPKGVYAAVGLHPIHVVASPVDTNELGATLKLHPEKFDPKTYCRLAKKSKVVAIGEAGLDYAYAKTETDKKAQQQSFIAQIELARDLGLPLIIHCRDAWDDLIKILEDWHGLKGVGHFFSGSLEDAQKLIKMGFLVSFTGVISFTNAYDEIIRQLPLEKIMIETDCPYVAPVPFRGKRNLPLYVKYVAQKIAQIKEIDQKTVEFITSQNAKTLFGL